MGAWLFTMDLPLYLPEAIGLILEARGDSVDRVVFAPPPGRLPLRDQYWMFGLVDGLRMGRLYAQGRFWGCSLRTGSSASPGGSIRFATPRGPTASPRRRSPT